MVQSRSALVIRPYDYDSAIEVILFDIDIKSRKFSSMALDN